MPGDAVQIWECGSCGYKYEAPIALLSIVCSNRHKSKNMELISGEKLVSSKAAAKPQKQPPKDSSRPKAQQVTNTKLLFEALGIKE